MAAARTARAPLRAPDPRPADRGFAVSAPVAPAALRREAPLVPDPAFDPRGVGAREERHARAAAMLHARAQPHFLARYLRDRRHPSRDLRRQVGDPVVARGGMAM